jgi:copper chaperone CopZ
MKLLKSVLAFTIVLLGYFSANGQEIHNAKTARVKIYGNCGMCEKTIEKAAFKKGRSKADWDMDTQMAQLQFDSTKTSVEKILKRVAASGYDSDDYRASAQTYSKLHACCQYERPKTAPGRKQ